MRLTQEQHIALSIAKEITIAKLSQSAPSHSDAAAGEQIGKMLTEIYKSVLKIMDEESPQ